MAANMRGVYTNLTEIRRRVFSEVARIIYELGSNPENTDEDFDREVDNARKSWGDIRVLAIHEHE